MGYYLEKPLNSEEVSREAGAKVYSLGTGASHERLIQQAGGEIGYDGFEDPRPNEEGNMIAEKVFINEETKKIQGINFSKNGQFCCAYMGLDYSDIKDSNRRDCKEKQENMEADCSKVDEFGIDISKGVKSAPEVLWSTERLR